MDRSTTSKWLPKQTKPFSSMRAAKTRTNFSLTSLTQSSLSCSTQAIRYEHRAGQPSRRVDTKFLVCFSVSFEACASPWARRLCSTMP